MTCKRNMNGFKFGRGSKDYYILAPYAKVTNGFAKKIALATGKTDVRKEEIVPCVKIVTETGVTLKWDNGKGTLHILFKDLAKYYEELEVNI